MVRVRFVRSDALPGGRAVGAALAGRPGDAGWVGMGKGNGMSIGKDKMILTCVVYRK